MTGVIFPITEFPQTNYCISAKVTTFVQSVFNVVVWAQIWLRRGKFNFGLGCIGVPPFHPFPHHHYQDDPHYKDPQHYQDHHHPHVWTVVTFLEAIAPFGRWYRSRAADGRALEKDTFVWPLASSVLSLPWLSWSLK